MNWFRRLLSLASFSADKPDNSKTSTFIRAKSGAIVTVDTALAYSAVFGCVRVIAETVAQLPWKTYTKNTKGKKDVLPEKNTVAWLLAVQPNPETTAFNFKRQLVANALTWGNAFAEIERDGSGRPLWLWSIHPERVVIERSPGGDLQYRVRNSGQADAFISPADIIHVRCMGDDDSVGTSIIQRAAQSVGLGIAMEQFGASFFGNGANMGGALTHPRSLSPEARANLEESMKKRAGGGNALSTVVLEEGMKYEKIGIPPNDAQFLESRQFQVIEICRWFRVPPHKLQDLSRATWNNIEHQSIEFVTDTIVPWTAQLEQEADLKLFGRQNRGVYYTKFKLAALLRGDTATRYAAYSSGRQWGWLSVNDIRELEDMNRIDGGDQYLVPSNMTTPDGIDNAAEKAGEPAPLPGQGGAKPAPGEDPIIDAGKLRALLNSARLQDDR